MKLSDALELLAARADDRSYTHTKAQEARRVHDEIVRLHYMARGLSALMAKVKPRLDQSLNVQADLAEDLSLIVGDLDQIADKLAAHARAVQTVLRAYEGAETTKEQAP